MSPDIVAYQLSPILFIHKVILIRKVRRLCDPASFRLPQSSCGISALLAATSSDR